MKREDLEAREFGLIIASSNFPFYAAPEADAVMDAMETRIEELEAENKRLKKEIERLEGFCNELNKDCKWLPTTHTPTINGFETMVLCTNGKKRVASFRMFDSHWYDVNNGNKQNVVKWLWQPSMAKGEG